MNPTSVLPSCTASAACSLLVAVSTTVAAEVPKRAAAACNDTNQRGISCSAMVWLAATLTRARLSSRSDASAVSTCVATASSLAAHSATATPVVVS